MDEKDKANEVLKKWERGKANRGTFETHWQQCANYMQPDRADYITERAPGARRMQYIFDSTPLWCLEQYTAGMHSLLTSSTLQWFFLRCDDDRLNKDEGVRQWLDGASAAMYAIFNSPRRAFSTASQELYADEGLIGSACMAVLEGRTADILFSTRHMKECIFFENDEDRVDTVVRRWPFSASQAVKAFGENAGEKVRAAAEKDAEGVFYFLHCVQPRAKRDPQRTDRKHKAFESVWIGEADKVVIDEGGYDEFPYLCPRLSKVTGEIYGRGRGMIALPDVKMLNELAKLVVKSGQKVLDPPLDVPMNGYMMPIKTTPGSLIYRRQGMRLDDRIAPIETHGQVQVGDEMLNTLRNSIGRVFFVDLLRMPTDLQDPLSEGKGSTATYWLQRREKEMLALSPMLSRMQSEFSGPLIDRVFALCWRQSLRMQFGPGAYFPPPPPALSSAKLRVEYVSPIALAQKSSQLDSIDRLIARQMSLRQVDPTCELSLDCDAIMRLEAEGRNAPVPALKSREQMEQEAEARQQAQEQMANQAAVESAAGAAADGAGAISDLAGAQMQEAA